MSLYPLSVYGFHNVHTTLSVPDPVNDDQPDQHSRCADVRRRDADVLLPDTEAGGQAQVVLRPQHGSAQHAAARPTQEQEEVSVHTHRHTRQLDNRLIRGVYRYPKK